MTFETTYEPENEQATIILEDSLVLKATLGTKGEIMLNDAFRDLQEDNFELYSLLRKLVKDLFQLTDQ